MHYSSKPIEFEKEPPRPPPKKNGGGGNKNNRCLGYVETNIMFRQNNFRLIQYFHALFVTHCTDMHFSRQLHAKCTHNLKCTPCTTDRPYDSGLAEIAALDGSQEVVVNIQKCSFLVGQYLPA